MSEVLVLSVRPPYKVKSREDGREIEGFSVAYKEIGLPDSPLDETMGPVIITQNFSDVSLRQQFAGKPVPGVYDYMTREIRSTKGKKREIVEGWKYLRPMELEDIDPAAKPVPLNIKK